MSKQINQEDISTGDMIAMQEHLRITKGWTDTDPVHAKDHMLNMIGEIGEVASIFKKKGIEKCMTVPEIRAEMVEELADVQMYFIEVLNRLGVSAQEFSHAYIQKYNKNLGRDYTKEWSEKIVDETRSDHNDR